MKRTLYIALVLSFLVSLAVVGCDDAEPEADGDEPTAEEIEADLEEGEATEEEDD